MTWIILLRGINVGGKNIVPMRELVTLLESLGLANVRTYVQSGNVVAESSSESVGGLEQAIASSIEDRFGFRPQILLLTADELNRAAESNPFPEAEADPKTLHLFFLASVPGAPNLDAIERVRVDSERFHLADRVFYLHAPDGFGRSKLAASVERHLGVAVTARNWRTVGKLQEMAGAG